MKTPLTTISGSSIQDFNNCKRRWCYRWIEGRIPRFTPQALTTGKGIHLAFEYYFTKGTPLDTALIQVISEYKEALLDPKEMKALTELEGLVEPLGKWKDVFPIDETLEAEKPFEFDLKCGLTFQGRPDRVVRIGKNIFHFQHKTIDGRANIGLFLDTARRSLHELVYGWHLEQKYCPKINGNFATGSKREWSYGGTIYNVIRKLQYKSTAKQGKPPKFAVRNKIKELDGVIPHTDDPTYHGDEMARQVAEWQKWYTIQPTNKILHTPEEFFTQQIIDIDPVLQAEALAEIEVTACEMLETYNSYIHNRPIRSNRGLDRGPYGNSNDPYTRVMLNEASLTDDTLFMDKEDLYAKEEGELG